jgi:hypothetical protein
VEHYGSFPDFIEQINFQVFLKLKHDESKVEHLFVVPGSARQFKIVLVEYPIPQLVTLIFFSLFYVFECYVIISFLSMHYIIQRLVIYRAVSQCGKE